MPAESDFGSGYCRSVTQGSVLYIEYILTNFFVRRLAIGSLSMTEASMIATFGERMRVTTSLVQYCSRLALAYVSIDRGIPEVDQSDQ